MNWKTEWIFAGTEYVNMYDLKGQPGSLSHNIDNNMPIIWNGAMCMFLNVVIYSREMISFDCTWSHCWRQRGKQPPARCNINLSVDSNAGEEKKREMYPTVWFHSIIKLTGLHSKHVPNTLANVKCCSFVVETMKRKAAIFDGVLCKMWRMQRMVELGGMTVRLCLYKQNAHTYTEIQS